MDLRLQKPTGLGGEDQVEMERHHPTKLPLEHGTNMTTSLGSRLCPGEDTVLRR